MKSEETIWMNQNRQKCWEAEEDEGGIAALGWRSDPRWW